MFFNLGLGIYIIGKKVYNLLLVLISPFNTRAKNFVDGRKGLFDKIAINLKNDLRKSIWFHVSSLGEFEQARPVIEQLKIIYPNFKYIITVYSPSGYEVRKNDKIADYIFYLPNDSKKNAQKLVGLFNPEMAFWVKYDFWFFYLNELKKQNIPTYLIVASFNKNQLYFKFYGRFLQKMIQNFTFIFTQNEISVELLKNIGINHATCCGDTRFDRVYNELIKTQEIDIIKQFKGDNLLIVLGSSYLMEEKFLASFLIAFKHLNVKIIIAPHFVNESRILEIENDFKNISIRFSKLNASLLSNFKVLVIDNIGMLNKIYKYADISFVGGGFVKKGLHNILEAAVFSNAIMYGNQIDYFPEAIDFSKTNAALIVSNQNDFNLKLNELIKNVDYREKLGRNANQLILNNVGATQKIISYINKQNN